MAYENNFTVIGNLTKKPEINYHTNKKGDEFALCKFNLAANKPGKDDETLFIDVSIFGSLGEACAEYLDKGSPVYITGELIYDTWKDENGKNISKISLKATNVQFLNPKEKSETKKSDKTNRRNR
jgi:single-strand DNA-binding protein